MAISKKVVKDPEHRFLWHLCKMFGKLPDDDFFEELDPIIRAYMYNHWALDIKEKMDYAKELGLLIGSFINYDAVKKIIDKENPQHTMSDEEFDKLSMDILNKNKEEDEVKTEQPKRKRKRKLAKKV